MNNISIFTDGASRGNPGPGGWGAVVVTAGESDSVIATVTELGDLEEKTTNNRMELTAVIEALSFLEVETADTDFLSNPITIYTDSSYVLNGATKWLKGWERNDWQTKTKDDVLNKDLWERMSAVLQGKKIKWHLVSGHVGVAGNERADKISTEFADDENPVLFSGLLDEYQKKYKIDILNISHDAGAKAKRSGSKSRSKAPAYSYVSKVDGKIQIHKTWAETEKRVKGAKGALYKKATSPAEENDIVSDFKSR